MSNPLRNPNIDYERGWFSITVQVAHIKSVFGAIVGEKCELNALGWRCAGEQASGDMVQPVCHQAGRKRVGGLHPPRRQPGNSFEGDNGKGC